MPADVSDPGQPTHAVENQEFISLSIRAIEPRIPADYARANLVTIASEERIECKAIGVEIVSGKPPVGDVGRSGKPLPALRTVADKNGGTVLSFNQANGSCGAARFE
jgi:hypothetical protein